MTTEREHDDALRLPPMSRRMQAFSMVAVFALGVVSTWFVFGNPLGLGFLPGDGAHAERDEPATAASPAVYRCPMHPEVMQDHPGDCPICHMALVEVEPQETTLYRCPMHPEVVQDQPGNCPICGMPLVEEAAAPGSASELLIDPVQVQTIGLVSVAASMEDVSRSSRTVGYLDYNIDDVVWVNTKFEGWVETVHVDYVGQRVRAGQPLFEIYSPELVTTQEEYLRTLAYLESMRETGRPDTVRQAEGLLRSARERLAYFDVSEPQIRRLEETREASRLLVVESPADGVVAEIMQTALEGRFVKPGMDLYRIADLSTVWVHAEVYESDMGWVRPGLTARVSFRNDAADARTGEVLFLYPEVSRATRTLKICVELANPDGRLRPGMYADVAIDGPPVRDAVVVPKSAVIRTGERNIVFVDLGNGRFRPQEVRLGIAGRGDRLQIVEGVEPGQRVVVESPFLLDSESRMQEALAKFVGGNDRPAPAHEH